MRIYSKSVETFLQRIHVYVREILENEFKVRVAKTRFHLSSGWNYPIFIVAIEDPQVLGRFDHEDYAIEINKCLMYKAEATVIKNILRHELAHYFFYIENQNTHHLFSSHGSEFIKFCRRYGFGEEVYSASVDLRKENEVFKENVKSEKIIEKIQKLLSLAESDNPNEAELATVKANQLIVQHNLESIANAPESRDEIEYVTKLVLKSPRWTPRLSAISGILKEFFVHPVKTNIGLEITGIAANIKNGEYIAHFLEHKLKEVWYQHKREHPKLREKAFMVALSSSYRFKLEASHSKVSKKDRQALVAMDKELDWATNSLYGGLRGSANNFVNCVDSAILGNKAGRDLQINRGVSTNGEAVLLLK